MTLYTNCTSCKADIRIKSNAFTRPDLQMEKGTEFNVNCSECETIQKKHVNDVRAEEGKLMLLIGIVLGIIVTIVLCSLYGAIGTASIVIPILFWQQQIKATKTFNSYMVKRK